MQQFIEHGELWKAFSTFGSKVISDFFFWDIYKVFLGLHVLLYNKGANNFEHVLTEGQMTKQLSVLLKDESSKTDWTKVWSPYCVSNHL